jgi:hypothetical protein
LFEPLPAVEFAREAKWQKGTEESIERKPLMPDKKEQKEMRAKKKDKVVVVVVVLVVHELKEVCSIYNQPKVKSPTPSAW